MKAYVIVTGVIFGVLTLAHIWRAAVAEPHLAREPWYIFITAATAGFGIWAALLCRRAPRA